MLTSRARNSFGTRGFSLIETIVALSVVALASAVAAPSLSGAVARARLDASARTLINGLKQARRQAIAGQDEVALRVDTETGEAWINSVPFDIRLPADASLSMTTAASERSGQSEGGIRFFADGSSTGGEIVLVRRDRAHRLRVDWLTGRIEPTR